MSDNSTPNDSAPPSEEFNEECVICLEALSNDSSAWGRCTPCGHAFHKSCWWQWENAHNERVDRARRRGEIPPNEQRPPRCCLCNRVNEKFVDAEGQPVQNPEPFVASEDNNEQEGSEFGFGSMSFNPENFTLENVQQAIRETGVRLGMPTELVDDPNFVRQFSEQVMGGVSNPFSQGMGGFNPASMIQNMFGGGASSSSTGGNAPAAPHNNAQSNNSNNVGPPFNEIRPGTAVVTQNLISSPELNGRHGQITRLDPSNGRYLVRLRPSAHNQNSSATTTVAIKPQNLLQMAQVKVRGLQSQPHLNGLDGMVRSYSSERDRYVVRVAYVDPEVFSSLPPEMQLEVRMNPPETRDISVSCNNILIPVGTHVRLEGLEQRVQWNGKYGRIVRWIDGGEGDEGGRYEVRLSRQYAVLAKPQNVRL